MLNQEKIVNFARENGYGIRLMYDWNDVYFTDDKGNIISQLLSPKAFKGVDLSTLNIKSFKGYLKSDAESIVVYKDKEKADNDCYNLGGKSIVDLLSEYENEYVEITIRKSFK